MLENMEVMLCNPEVCFTRDDNVYIYKIYICIQIINNADTGKEKEEGQKGGRGGGGGGRSCKNLAGSLSNIFPQRMGYVQHSSQYFKCSRKANTQGPIHGVVLILCNLKACLCPSMTIIHISLTKG